MDVTLLQEWMTNITLAVCSAATMVGCLLLIVAKRGAEGRSKYKFEKWLNSPSPKPSVFDAIVNAINKMLTRKPEKRMK